MKLQQSISRRAKKNWVGRELTVLAEGPSAETPLLWEARTEFHAPEIDGKVFINDFGPLEDLEPGRFYRAVSHRIPRLRPRRPHPRARKLAVCLIAEICPCSLFPIPCLTIPPCPSTAAPSSNPPPPSSPPLLSKMSSRKLA